MLETLTERSDLLFKELTPEEKERRGILGRLQGQCASVIKATRNQRRYSDELWEKVFEDPITKELLDKGGIPGELDHPADRIETCSEKIAIMMPEAPKKDKDGRLVGYWDIIDTPCGRIAYALAKYGFKLGISSRGEGDVVTDYDGNEAVDPDTYHFSAFDLVLIPACEDARLSLVEGLNRKEQQFKKAINEELAKATPEHKEIMEKTLLDLGLLKEEIQSNPQSLAAKNIGATVVSELQEALLAKQKAEAKVLELQEKLSVSYAKETKNEEEVAKYKTTIKNLSESASSVRALQKEIDSLKEELSQKNTMISQIKERYTNLLTEKRNQKQTQEKLNESLSNTNKTLESKNNEIKKLNESLEQLKKENSEKENLLNEKLSDIRKDLEIKSNEYSRKLAKSNQLIEKYINTAKKAVNKYIESKANLLGVNPDSIKNKLPKNYSFDDIDSVCENLNHYQLNVSKLPINLSDENFNVEFKKPKESLIPTNGDNDDIDESLLILANLK